MGQVGGIDEARAIRLHSFVYSISLQEEFAEMYDWGLPRCTTGDYQDV